MEYKVFDSELKVMEVLWKEGDLSAAQISKILYDKIGWNRNTTYTVIMKLVKKGAIKRSKTGYMCKALITKDQVRVHQAEELLGKLFDGSVGLLLSAFVNDKELSDGEVKQLKELVQKHM